MEQHGGKVFLKRIEMLGFKSFADRTSIEFVDGITALLGPNGCGKSNIVDAVKWVLGEQSVRNMRAERMEDVIFGGSEKRKALSAAEVTITIANDSGLLEIERPEIAIKRRIFRDGESEYFLNGAPARLKELRGLFHDTGIGKSVYSVMEQGRIDRVLFNKSEEFRYLLEEAAGITRYRMRESEAERKLAKTEENMKQVEGVLHEVGKNYESLKKQSEKALEYRRLQESIFSLDRNLKLVKLRELESGRNKKEEKLRSRRERRSKLIGKIDEIKSELAAELKSVEEMRTRLVECQKLLYGMDLKKENQKDLARSVRERREEAGRNFNVAEIRKRNALDIIHSLEGSRRDRENELNSLRDRLDAIGKGIGNSAGAIESSERRLEENAYEAKGLGEELAVQERQGEKLGERLRLITDNIVSKLDRGLKDSDYNRNTRRDLESSISKLINELRVRAEGSGRLLMKNPGNPAGASELLKRGAEDFLVLKQSVEELNRLFNEYRQFEAVFLEESLAPEGIITKKRELDREIVASVNRSRELRGRRNCLLGEKTDLEAKIGRARGELEKLKVAQARIGTQMDAAGDLLAAHVRELNSENIRLREIQEQLDSEEARIRNLDMRLSNILSRGKELESGKAKLRREITKLEEEINSRNERIADRESILEELGIRRDKAQLEGEKIRLEIDYREEEIKSLLKDFRDRYSRDLTDYVDDAALTQSPREVKEALKNSRVRLKELGQVNLMAPEDFAEVSEHYEFLNSQFEDIRKAKNNLAMVTEELRRESANLFLQIHKEIRKHFHETFRFLFGGGRAEIRLVNREDPLNSELEIYVQPPGKKLENISLLSGGERSLCGIALMFATFQVKPSPFYILDEIDAALDEANIQRFVNLLLDSKRESQFLLITHNKRTISCAGNLLGVTMQESGVSSIVTLKLDERERKKDEEPIAVGQ